MSDSVTSIQDEAGGLARGVEGEDCLDAQVVLGHIEGLEHDLGHTFAVVLGVARGLGQHGRVLVAFDPQLVVVHVVPDQLHIAPVDHDPVLHRVCQLKDAPLGLCLLPNKHVLVVRSDLVRKPR